MNNVIKLWHGGRFKEGDLQIKAGKQINAEHGPGIYTTTHRQTADKYAKGGGQVTYIELCNDICWLEKSKIPCDALIEFLENTPNVKNRKAIIKEVLTEIQQAKKLDNTIYASILTNFCHIHNALSGNTIMHIARFYVENGIHASLVTHGEEDWVVILDPSKIVEAKIIPRKIMESDFPSNFDKIAVQLQKMKQKSDTKSTVGKLKAMPMLKH